ncbi:hypothetical protein A0H81_00629 [Grifola frondosa]|uniref:Uncharacterized protein n=1 Tax=Grifola frondosa TaxID=5627 RepID=A0A1C7MPQ2_GRIFR|nr:hypothetical protein A0H81_00629 [Grifola frondosa]
MSPRNAGKKDGRRKKASLSSTGARVAKPELRSPSPSALVSSENKVPLDQSHAVDSNPISTALDTTTADNSGTTCQLRFNTSFHPWRFPPPSPDNANQG